jgi:hypothetical protein
MKPTELAHIALNMGRRLQMLPDGQVTALDGLPLPSDQELAEALAALRTRKTLRPDQFRRLFTPAEIHAVIRKGTLTTVQAVACANAWAQFTTSPLIRSDNPDLAAALDLFVAAEILTPERRERIAQFLPPL